LKNANELFDLNKLCKQGEEQVTEECRIAMGDLPKELN
jgi:hypothetical protein